MLKYPYFLFLTVLPVFFTVYYLAGSGKAFEQFYTYSYLRDKKKKKKAFLFRRNISVLLICAASFFMITALASPFSFYKSPGTVTDNSSIVQDYSFAVDISNSMNADDGDGSRLEKVKNSLVSYIFSDRSSSRYSVTVFKGNSAVLLPLTTDKKLVVSVIEKLSPDMFTSKGTSFYPAVESASAVFPDNEKSIRKLIIFTDGEESEKGRFEKEIKKLAGIIKGEMIEPVIIMPDKNSGSVVPGSNANHISIPDFNLMEEAAGLWGGKVIRISDFSASVLSSTEYTPSVEKEYKGVFLFFSFFFLFLSAFLGRIKL